MAFPTLVVTPGTGQTINTLPAAGQDVKANSLPVVIASDQGALSVSGTFWQATQPVSGTFWQATQPVSAVSLPLPTGAAADATLTGGTQTTRVTDGTNTASVKAASTLPAATDKALVVTARDSISVTGTFWQATQPVSLASVPSHAVTNAGTFAVQASCAGDVAAAATDSGNPQKIGGVGKTANPTAVTDGQRVNAIFDKLGKLVVVGTLRDLRKTQQTTITSSTTETTIITAGGVGVFNDLLALIITNTSATATKVTIKDATAGTTRMVLQVPAATTVSPVLPNDGFPQSAANAAWSLTCGTSVAGVEVSAVYTQNT
jgi:hypothetical protein